MSTNETLLNLWAKRKAVPPSEIRYPLLYHMLDVAMVAQELWSQSLHSWTRGYYAEQLGLSEDQAKNWIAFWAGLHDIGKASPPFQSQSEHARQQLTAQGFHFFPFSNPVSHGVITACILNEQFGNMLPQELGKRIATTTGGHHGIFPRSEDILNAGYQRGNKAWKQAHQALVKAIATLCQLDFNYPSAKTPGHSFFMFLAGLISVADWIASNDTYFSYDQIYGIPEEHCKYSKEHAIRALRDLGWAGWQPPNEASDFNILFPFIKIKRPLQTETVTLAKDLGKTPGLVIIEAPMGEGKTEAAMYLADHWAATMGQRGCYFALPTQATSNQMFGRAVQFLENRYHSQIVNLMLLHGHAALSAEFDILKRNADRLFEPRNIGEKEVSYDGASAAVLASEWFTHRKRGLLAPFGVGTIDQALLAVLQTKHAFVRLFGLSGKTIIIDEVHAYDAYMSTLIERLLEWLAALGSSVILLSATLPKKKRDELLQAYQRGLNIHNKTVPLATYPRISWVTLDTCHSSHIDTSLQSSKTILFEWIDGNLTEKTAECFWGQRLQQMLSDGGCAAVICNTVDSAQKMYLALKNYFPGIADDGYPELDLLHARYLFGEREQREKRTLLRFGKPNAKIIGEGGIEHQVQRPNRAVLVATQIIEQSLDLDFDLMVTEMAPIDLLFQRAGRLQRHQRKRPERFEGNLPTLWVCQPGRKEDGTPDFGNGTEKVYDRHVLLRSWLVLQDEKYASGIRIPGDIEELVEAVYDERNCPKELPCETRKDWDESFSKHKKQLKLDADEAQERWIKHPNYGGELWRMTMEPREEDAPDLHTAHQALTRLTGLTASITCLYGTEATPCLDAQLSLQLDSYTTPDIALIKKLLKRSVKISHAGLVTLINQKGKLIPEAWRQSPLLRHHYLLCFDQRNSHHLENYEMHLDGELGLVIERNTPGEE